MKLTLIEKYLAPADGMAPKIKIKGDLSTQEAVLLADFFVLGTLIDNDGKKALHTLCRTIHERDLWIQCDCLTSSIQPVFRINRASSGNFYLHRITSREEHADSCLFKERVYERYDRESPERQPILKSNVPFNLIGKKSQGVIKPSDDKSEQNRKGGEGVLKVARALFNLLEAAGLNVVVHSDNRSKPQDALVNAAKSLELRKGLFLAEYLESNPNRIKYRATCLKEDKAWPKGDEKHCLALIRVKSFNEDSLEVIFPDKTTQPLKIATRIYQSSGRFSERTAPYMALVVISTTAQSPWFYQPVKAYVMPTYSDESYFPVDSFYEREVMRHLYRLYFKAIETGSPFQIIKPLLGIELPPSKEGEKRAVLPDFLIQKGNKTLVIEVNGSMEDSYLERKARTHEQMKELGELYHINAYLAESQNQLSQEIVRLMNRISQWLSLN
jgi:hypothetical protein